MQPVRRENSVFGKGEMFHPPFDFDLDDQQLSRRIASSLEGARQQARWYHWRRFLQRYVCHKPANRNVPWRQPLGRIFAKARISERKNSEALDGTEGAKFAALRWVSADFAFPGNSNFGAQMSLKTK